MTDKEYIIDFGKYKGQSLRWIIDNDRSYAKWMYENVKRVALKVDANWPDIKKELSNSIPSDMSHEAESASEAHYV